MTAKHSPPYDRARWFAEVGGEIKVYIEAEEYPGGPPIDPPRIIVRCRYEIDGVEFGLEDVIDVRDQVVSIGVATDYVIDKMMS